MKWITLLLLGVLQAEGIVAVAPKCDSEQKVDVELLVDQWTIGASAVPALTIRNISAESFAEQYMKIRTGYGLSVAKRDYVQISAVGQDLITAIRDLWAQLQRSLKETPVKAPHSGRVNEDMNKVNDQLDTFLSLKPGNQEIELELNEMPAEPKFESKTKNLTAADAFLHLGKIKDDGFAAQAAFVGSLFWNGWKAVRKYLSVIQNEYRNEVLNNQVMPVYRKIVNDISCSDVQGRVDKETWGRFAVARKCIVELSNEYIKSLETGEKCYTSRLD